MHTTIFDNNGTSSKTILVQQGNTLFNKGTRCSTREQVLRHSKSMLLEHGRWNSMLQQVLPSERQSCNKNYPTQHGYYARERGKATVRLC
jgi:Tfp pilus assembly PilM family ATPase